MARTWEAGARARREGGEWARAKKGRGGAAHAGRGGEGRGRTGARRGAARALLTLSSWRPSFFCSSSQKIALQLKATLENVTNLRPVGEDFRWYLKVRLWWGRQGRGRVKVSHPDLSGERELSLRLDEKCLLHVLFSSA